MDNQHRLVKGYREFNAQELDAINSIKLAELDIGQLWQQIGKVEGVDPRYLNIARTQLEQAFSSLVRSVAKPLDVFTLVLPEETFLDRLKRERDDLTDKLEKLKAFVASDKFASLDDEAQSDLTLQVEVMTPYAFIVSKRYDDAVAKQAK